MTDAAPHARWRLFQRLIAEALGRADTRAPQVLVGKWPSVPSTGWEPGWPVIEAGEALVEEVQQRLPHGPVVVLPTFEQLPREARRQDGLIVQNVYESVLVRSRPTGPDSLLLAIVPHQLLIGVSSDPVRTAVMEHWHPELIVYVADALPSTPPDFQFAAVLFRAKGSASTVTRFFEMPAPAPEEKTEADFKRLLTMPGGRCTNGYVVREAVTPGDSLAFDLRNPAVLARRDALADFGTAVPLNDLYEIQRPDFRVMAPDHHRTAPEDGTFRIITGGDIGRDGAITPADEQTRWADAAPHARLRAGDLLIRDAFGLGKSFAVAEVTAEDLPATNDHRVIVLRPRDGAVSEIQRLFVRTYLRTPLARTLVTDNVVPFIIKEKLAELPVPQPDATLSAALHDLTAAADRLAQWRSDAMAVVESAMFAEPKVARERLLESGRLLRMRSDAAGLLDDFGHTVRTRFPHPVAYRWRRVEAEVGAGELGPQALEAVLEAAEILLCYAAGIALTMARSAGLTVGATEAIREKLRRGSGPSMGDWIAVLTELNSRAFTALPHDQPLGEIRRMLPAGPVDRARQRLSKRRNDLAHLRRGDRGEEFRTAYADLVTLLENAMFLCDLKLVHLTDVRWDSIRKVAVVHYRELMGDHSVVPTRILEYPSNDLEQGSLYVTDTGGALHLLRPFLVGSVCPRCTHWSTFHVDTAPRGAEVTLKSLEHGHSMSYPGLREPLELLGLL